MSPLPSDPGERDDDEGYEIVEDDGQTDGGGDDVFEAGEDDGVDQDAQTMDFPEPAIQDRASLEGQQFSHLQAAFAFLQEQGLFTQLDTVQGALRNGNLVLGEVMLTIRKGATIVLTEQGIRSILGEFSDE